MLTNNVGPIDRVIRLGLGALLLLAPATEAAGQLPVWLLPAVGVVLILTALVGFCPLYRLFGLSTARPSITTGAKRMNYRSIDADYAVTGQIEPAEMAAISAAGFKSIVCARPDNEDFGQPSFDEVAKAAEAQGLQVLHVPVSGMVSQGAFMRFSEAMKDMPKPVLAYCRSGGRAASLYSMYKNG